MAIGMKRVHQDGHNVRTSRPGDHRVTDPSLRSIWDQGHGDHVITTFLQINAAQF